MPRIDKLLSQTGFWSRKQVKELIREGRVLLGDEPVLSPSQDVTYEELNNLRLFLEDEIEDRTLKHVINNRGHAYIILNKPIGYISTTETEADYPSFLELLISPLSPNSPKLPEKLIMRLSPSGRLDVDSRGLLLITTHGALIHRITHPKWGLDKEYVLKLKGGAERLNELLKGVDIGGEVLRAETLSYKVDGDEIELRVTLKHGPYRGLRRAMRRLGLSVMDLKRIRIGPINLSSLAEGSYRFLTGDEVRALLRATKLLE